MEHSDYQSFGYDLLNYCKDYFFHSTFSASQNREYKVLNLGDSFSLRFLEWGKKPYYLILFRGEQYLFELELIKILKTENKYTWYLSKPRNKNNVRVLDRRLQYYQTVDINYRNQIKKIKMDLFAGQVVYKEGYLLIKEGSWLELKKKFLEILPLIIYEHLSCNIVQNQNLTFGIDDHRALEGYQSDKKYLINQRNQRIVLARKAKDNNTCQVCDFRLANNGKYVIECHHLYPIGLGYERITAIDDLVCLCPTCHRIAHTREYPYDIEEIQDILNKNKYNLTVCDSKKSNKIN